MGEIKYTLIHNLKYILRNVSRDTIMLYLAIKEINLDEDIAIIDERGKEINLNNFRYSL